MSRVHGHRTYATYCRSLRQATEAVAITPRPPLMVIRDDRVSGVARPCRRFRHRRSTLGGDARKSAMRLFNALTATERRQDVRSIGTGRICRHLGRMPGPLSKRYGADPHLPGLSGFCTCRDPRSQVRGPVDMKVSAEYGNVYWNEPDGHQWEMLIMSYARKPGQD